jgi:hypothetical protein
MDNTNGGGPAFPTNTRTELRPVMSNAGGNYEHRIPATDGMTLRDYFAAHIVGGVVADSNVQVSPASYDEIAQNCYALADALLKARG